MVDRVPENTSLLINDKGDIAFFHDGVLPFIPEWASLDIEHGEICIVDKNTDLHRIKLNHIDQTIYSHMKTKTKIMLVRVDDTPERKPLEAMWITLNTALQLD